MNTRDRVRLYRRRQSTGRAVYRIEVDDAALTDMLVSSGYLANTSADNRDKVRVALERLIASLVAMDVQISP